MRLNPDQFSGKNPDPDGVNADAAGRRPTTPGAPDDTSPPTAPQAATEPTAGVRNAGARTDEIGGRIRLILRDHARLQGDATALEDEANLFEAGMSSHASVSVLIALEETFDVEFPDEMLTRDVFASVANLRAAISELAGP